MSRIDYMEVNGVLVPVGGDTVAAAKMADRLYTGVELPYKFSEIKSMLATQSVELGNIHVSDYIPLTLTTGEICDMQIAGIDTYYNTTDQAIPHHIDFISKDCLTTTVQWNTTNKNNAAASGGYPWLESNLYSWLNNTVLNYIPTDVKNLIANKRFLLEQRSGGSTTESTGWGWQDIGKLWVPTEFEVFGTVVWVTKGYSAMQSVQYPIFANNWLARIKGAGRGGSRAWWWELSARGGDTTGCCHVGNYGNARYVTASAAGRAPLCFRITA